MIIILIFNKRYSSYPTFNTPDAIASALKNTGFDIISTINNHTFDKGSHGFDRTLSVLKELNFEYFSLDEIEMLKMYGTKVIMNVMYLCEESLSFVDYYSIQAVGDTKVTKNCYKLIAGIDRFMEYYRSGKKIKLILWGSIDKLFLQYEIIDRDKLESLVSCISLVKKPWDYYTDGDLLVLDKDR